jgi:hypothetical protein
VRQEVGNPTEQAQQATEAIRNNAMNLIKIAATIIACALAAPACATGMAAAGAKLGIILAPVPGGVFVGKSWSF